MHRGVVRCELRGVLAEECGGNAIPDLARKPGEDERVPGQRIVRIEECSASSAFHLIGDEFPCSAGRCGVDRSIVTAG